MTKKDLKDSLQKCEDLECGNINTTVADDYEKLKFIISKSQYGLRIEKHNIC